MTAKTCSECKQLQRQYAELLEVLRIKEGTPHDVAVQAAAIRMIEIDASYGLVREEHVDAEAQNAAVVRGLQKNVARLRAAYEQLWAKIHSTRTVL